MINVMESFGETALPPLISEYIMYSHVKLRFVTLAVFLGILPLGDPLLLTDSTGNREALYLLQLYLLPFSVSASFHC